MSLEALGGAPAPAETNTAALSAETSTQNNPISVQQPEAPAPVVPEKPKTVSDAVKAAQEDVKKRDATQPARDAKAAKVATAQEKPDTATGEAKAEPGVQPKQPQKEPTQPAQAQERPAQRYEAPARFNEQGKAEWEGTPESVKAEVHRTVKNLEDGFTKYRESAERYETLRQYDDMARASGRANGLSDSLKEISEIEDAFARNPIEGFQKVASYIGVDLNRIAHHIAGIEPDQRLAQLQSENQQLRQQMQQRDVQAAIPSLLDQFRTSNPRFDELQDDVAFFLSNMVKDGDPSTRLQTAYELAARLKPASSAPAPQSPQASPAVEAAPRQPNPAGMKSITGAPSSSAQQGKRKLSTSEAIKAAMAQR